ncbi:MAG: hypothetical protein K6D91_06145 [Prevotella sp.]|nr:hypothetical protein [Prevotella sp.]
MDYNQFQIVEDMSEVTHIFKKVFDGGKSYGTDTAKMGFFHGQMMAAKVEGNTIVFALPFNGPISMLQDLLTNTHYNKTNSIMVTCEVNDDNTELVATFYSKEFKLFSEL